MTADSAAPAARKKYAGVNGRWPEGTRDGRDLKPTPQEALAAAKRLYRKATGKPYAGTFVLTSGNRRTWYSGSKRMTILVNPDEGAFELDGKMVGGGGWHEIVHSISHMAALKLYGEAHGPRHAFIERELVDHVVKSGWLEGKLRRPQKAKPPVDPKAKRYAQTLAGIKRWEAKLRRAENALKKLRVKKRYYERTIA